MEVLVTVFVLLSFFVGVIVLIALAAMWLAGRGLR
jgi:hypothetical protein